jgi:hypothetical protein
MKAAYTRSPSTRPHPRRVSVLTFLPVTIGEYLRTGKNSSTLPDGTSYECLDSRPISFSISLGCACPEEALSPAESSSSIVQSPHVALRRCKNWHPSCRRQFTA